MEEHLKDGLGLDEICDALETQIEAPGTGATTKILGDAASLVYNYVTGEVVTVYTTDTDGLERILVGG